VIDRVIGMRVHIAGRTLTGDRIRSGQELPAADIPSIMMKEGRPASGRIKVCLDA